MISSRLVLMIFVNWHLKIKIEKTKPVITLQDKGREIKISKFFKLQSMMGNRRNLRVIPMLEHHQAEALTLSNQDNKISVVNDRNRERKVIKRTC